jgi:putative aldouronate transport system substrate-binding protein
MKKMGRAFLGAGLAVSMALVSACSSGAGTGNQQAQTPSSSLAAGEPVELVLGYPVLGEVPADIGSVEAEINKITLRKINAKVKLSRTSVSQWAQQRNLILAGNEHMDLFVTSFEDYERHASKNQLLELDELLTKEGKDIAVVLGDKLKAAKIKGHIYAIPTHNFIEAGTGILLRKDLLDRHGIDVSKIKGTNDLDAVFETMKQKENLLGVAAPNGQMPMTYAIDWLNYDPLVDSLGVLPLNSKDMKVVNLYEMPEYVEALKKTRSWYQAGYLPKDAVNAKTAPPDLMKNGEVFSIFQSNSVFLQDSLSSITGRQLVKVDLQKPVITTKEELGLMWAIPRNNVKNSQKAMELLNLLYTDKEIINLINYGIEGKHYKKVTGEVISRINDSGYSMNQPFMFGNRMLTYVLEGEDPALRQEYTKFTASFQKSPAAGFLPSTEAVSTEVVAVKNVLDQYRKALETGSVDPVKVHPDFVKKLKAAGIDTIIAEKQKQLDAWLAQK